MKQQASLNDFQIRVRNYKGTLRWMIIFICVSTLSIGYIVILQLFSGDTPERTLWIVVTGMLGGLGLFAASMLYATGVWHANPAKPRGTHAR